MTNQDIINKFFDCYSKRDFEAIKKVLAENVVWYFLGSHKLAGEKHGIHELLNFFDVMGAIMSKSKPSVEKLIVAEEGKYVIECQHIKTNNEDGMNIDHHVTVLWTIENGKIVSGRHFFADPKAVDDYFNAVG
jgi:ketosteroid isomerase-like protein